MTSSGGAAGGSNGGKSGTCIAPGIGGGSGGGGITGTGTGSGATIGAAGIGSGAGAAPTAGAPKGTDSLMLVRLVDRLRHYYQVGSHLRVSASFRRKVLVRFGISRVRDPFGTSLDLLDRHHLADAVDHLV